LINQLVDDEIDKITPEIIFKAADKKDKLARDIIEEAGQYLEISEFQCGYSECYQ